MGDGLMLSTTVSFVVIWSFLMFLVKPSRIEFWKISRWNMRGDAGRDEVDMMAVIDTLTAQQLQLPVILRFPDILHHRMRELQGCFSSAIAKFGYQVALSLP